MSRDADDIAWERAREAEYREEVMAGSLDRIADAMELLLEITKRSPSNVGWLVRKLLLGPAAVVQMGLEPNGDIYLAWGRRDEPSGDIQILVEEHAVGSAEVVSALIRLVDSAKAWRAQFEDDDIPF